MNAILNRLDSVQTEGICSTRGRKVVHHVDKYDAGGGEDFGFEFEVD